MKDYDTWLRSVGITDMPACDRWNQGLDDRDDDESD